MNIRSTLQFDNEMTFQTVEQPRGADAGRAPSAQYGRAPRSHAELVIEATGVNHAYEGQDGWVRALQHFEIAIPRNEFLCLLGPSGMRQELVPPHRRRAR